MKKFLFLILISLNLFASKGEMQILQPLTSTCPKFWLDEMKSMASSVEIVVVKSNVGIKREVGIPKQIQSCNTSFLDDYVFEGNVPGPAIEDFLNNTPKNAMGLALPSSENDKELKTVYVMFEDSSYKEFGKYK